MENALTVTNGKEIQPVRQAGTLANFTVDQRTIIKTTIMSVAVGKDHRNDAGAGITDDELEMFCTICAKTGLDPFLRQIYGLKRWDGSSGQFKLSVQVGIDGLRLIASRQPDYDGQGPIEWCGEDGEWKDVWTDTTMPLAARCMVYRKGHEHPFIYIAYYKECNDPYSRFWQTRGISQLAKCAEAGALRKAFPNDTAGLYIHEEMPSINVDVTEETEIKRAPQNGNDKKRSRNGSNGTTTPVATSAEPIETPEAKRRSEKFAELYQYMRLNQISNEMARAIATAIDIRKPSTEMTIEELESVLGAMKKAQATKTNQANGNDAPIQQEPAPLEQEPPEPPEPPATPATPAPLDSAEAEKKN